MIAVLIVIVLFVKVLEQFGLIEAGLEGKGVLFSGSSFFCSAYSLAARQEHLYPGYYEALPESPRERRAHQCLVSRGCWLCWFNSVGKINWCPENCQCKLRC